MKILDVTQGSQEWLDLREKYNTASDAPAMMGVSPYVTRKELIRQKATGDKPEYSDYVKNVVFANGHKIEEIARKFQEEILEQDLFPVVGINEKLGLLASYDGITMDGSIIWECKQMNQEKLAYMLETGRIPEQDLWQVVQQLIISDASYAIYCLSDGTFANTHTVQYELTPDDEAKLLNGWELFNADLANYSVGLEPVEVETVGRKPSDLPSLNIRIMGEVTESNLDQFKTVALDVLSSINRDLQTDQDFADAEKTVKWCSTVEKKLVAAKENALSQTASIDQLFCTIEQIKEETRSIRLELEKLVKSRKKAIRDEILSVGKESLQFHIDHLNKTLTPYEMPAIENNFPGVMKNKRTVKSLRAAVEGEVARLKVEATRKRDAIEKNIEFFNSEQWANRKALFQDLHSLIWKDSDDFQNLVKARVAEFEAAQEAVQVETEKAKAEEPITATEVRLRQENPPSVRIPDYRQEVPVIPETESMGLSTAIKIIEDSFPPDANYPHVAQVGNEIMMEAIKWADWRTLPPSILEIMAKLCTEKLSEMEAQAGG